MYKSIQACRGLAALQVVLFHLGGALALPKYFGIPTFARAFGFGNSGIEFFFVLSGFIITLVHRNDFGTPSRLPAFIWKRAIRIYPTYWLILGAAWVACLASPELRQGLPHDALTIAKTILLLPQDKNVVGGGMGAPVLVVAWTLQYEMLFYAFVALLILSRTLAVAVGVLFIANYTYCTGACGFPQSFLANDLIFLFALGAIVALLPKGTVSLRAAVLAACLGLAGFVYLAARDIILPLSTYSGRSLLLGLCFSILIFGLVRAEERGSGFGDSKWLLLLGGASYSLYLIHFPLLSALCKVAVALGARGYAGVWIAFIAILGACIGIAVFFHLRIEVPVLRYLSTRRLNGLVPAPALRTQK